MTWIIMIFVQLIRAGQKIFAKKLQFFGLFVILFLGTVFILANADLLPDASPAPTMVTTSENTARQEEVATNVLLPVATELPVKIDIPRINLYTVISNPTSTETAVLNKELLKGAVRYPISAKLHETGNVVLFGHSSYLPVVGNKAYKTFNDIQKLKAGDVVTMYSLDTAYTYSVRSVTRENVADDQGIPLQVSGRVLTLVTCNSFGTKEDRFVVIADFVDSHSISL